MWELRWGVTAQEGRMEDPQGAVTILVVPSFQWEQTQPCREQPKKKKKKILLS